MALAALFYHDLSVANSLFITNEPSQAKPLPLLIKKFYTKAPPRWFGGYKSNREKINIL